MYVPSHFAAPDQAALHQLMRDFPLATLVTLNQEGMEANHLPMLLEAGIGQHGLLRGHVARANPLWRDHLADKPVLAVFHGPQAYVSPAWYATKQQHGKVVPTWNYAAVHAHGWLRIRDDTDWLREQVTRLTTLHESTLPHPWAVADAPADYVGNLLQAIVGIEIEITRLEGKWKMSQNQPPENRAGVAEGLNTTGRADVAGWIKPH